MSVPLPDLDWPRVMPAPPAGAFKQQPEHFRVIEELGFAPEGDGKHIWCWVEKRGIDTLQAIKLIARNTGLRERDIGYSGIKDRQAITRQWVSLPTPILPAQAQLDALAQSGIHVLEAIPHPRKLKRGSHRRNRFALEISFADSARPVIEARWQRVVNEGVPNYFGAQRFGYQGANVARARALLARGWRKREDRHGLLLSSARSYLFNLALGARVTAGDWNQVLEGEVVNLDGTNSLFGADQEQPDRLANRLMAMDIHPTLPLWGKGEPGSSGQALLLEQQRVASEMALLAGLEGAGVALARRATRVRLVAPEWQAVDTGARITFSLARGAYATAVLRELISAPGL